MTLNFATVIEINHITTLCNMLKKQGNISIRNKQDITCEIAERLQELPDGDYEFYIYDKLKNRTLPQIKYLFSVVLKTISDRLPNHPPINALYRWYEQMFAPLHYYEVNGETFEYVDLKNEPSSELNQVIKKITDHAYRRWNIEIKERSAMNAPEARELYADAYADTWKDIITN